MDSISSWNFQPVQNFRNLGPFFYDREKTFDDKIEVRSSNLFIKVRNISY